MKALLLSTEDKQGGAARSTYRLHQGLQQIGVDSQMLVQTKRDDSGTVMGSPTSSGIAKAIAGLRLTVGQLPLKRYPQRQRHCYFSPQWLPDSLASQVAEIDPDVINLHWICDSYMRVETIAKLAKLNKPIVWTLSDMWPLTGGCHYSGSCDHFTQSCGHCPQLASQKQRDLSHWVWKRKAKTWKGLGFTIVLA